jgi:hypothetical protein
MTYKNLGSRVAVEQLDKSIKEIREFRKCLIKQADNLTPECINNISSFFQKINSVVADHIEFHYIGEDKT